MNEQAHLAVYRGVPLATLEGQCLGCGTPLVLVALPTATLTALRLWCFTCLTAEQRRAA